LGGQWKVENIQTRRAADSHSRSGCYETSEGTEHKIMKIKTFHPRGISVLLVGNPPHTRIFAELTEAELSFLQKWRLKIAEASRSVEARKALRKAKQQFLEIQEERKKREKNGS